MALQPHQHQQPGDRPGVLYDHLIIALYVADERRYDRFNHDAHNIYRVARTVVNSDGQQEPWATTVRAIALTLQPGPARSRSSSHRCTLRKDEHDAGRTTVPRTKHHRSGQQLLQGIHGRFLAGDPERALDDAQSIILTASTARHYFGHVDVKNLNVE
jgi:putative ABC transport system permease protein